MTANDNLDDPYIALPAPPRAPCAFCGKPTLDTQVLQPASDETDGLEAAVTEAVTVEYRMHRFFHNPAFPGSQEGGGQLRTVTLDICPACFKSKLATWFQMRGGEGRVQEDDWGEGTGYLRPEIA